MSLTEIAHYVPHPAIVLLGCQAWPPKPAGPGLCPVCGPGVRPRDHQTYCAVCQSMSPANEVRVRSQRLGVDGKTEQEVAVRKANEELTKRAKEGLSEAMRRRIWNGNRGGIRVENPAPTNVAKVGRDWLTERGMAPDWSLTLDGKGRVVPGCRVRNDAENAT